MLYLPGPDYRPHRFQPGIDRHHLVDMPVEEWSNTANARLAVTSFKRLLLNLGGGEQQVVERDTDRIHSRESISGSLIYDVPYEAGVLGDNDRIAQCELALEFDQRIT